LILEKYRKSFPKFLLSRPSAQGRLFYEMPPDSQTNTVSPFRENGSCGGLSGRNRKRQFNSVSASQGNRQSISRKANGTVITVIDIAHPPDVPGTDGDLFLFLHEKNQPRMNGTIHLLNAIEVRKTDSRQNIAFKEDPLLSADETRSRGFSAVFPCRLQPRCPVYPEGRNSDRPNGRALFSGCLPGKSVSPEKYRTDM